MSDRYHRQRLQIGDTAQQHLAAARVLVVGAGGLGCPALMYLAGAGIGTIGIIDPDAVDISNLHRQVLFTMSDIGENKAEAAAERLAALNPDITLHAFAQELTAENALALCAGYDLILDGSDSFAATYLINDVACKLGLPWIYAAMQGTEGRIAHFHTPATACYRCLYPTAPTATIRNCAEDGIIGALAGTIGSAMAMEAVQALIGKPALRGKLWTLDMQDMTSATLNLPKRAQCPTCAKQPSEIVPEYTSPSCAATVVEEITCAELPENAVLIDVREYEEWQAGHIANAQHLPLSAITRNAECFAPLAQESVVLYCQKGGRSRNAASLLLRAGFTDICSLRGGYEAWLRHHA